MDGEMLKDAFTDLTKRESRYYTPTTSHDKIYSSSKKDEDEVRVLTTNYIDVRVPFCPAQEKEEVKVKIIRVKGSNTFGSII